MGFRFKDFEVYREIRQLVTDVYKVSEKFPKSEVFGLTSQLRRAVISILLNVAEGSGKGSDTEFNRFVMIAIGSVNEVVACLDICLDLGYITTLVHEQFTLRCEALVRKLYGFSRKLKH